MDIGELLELCGALMVVIVAWTLSALLSMLSSLRNLLFGSEQPALAAPRRDELLTWASGLLPDQPLVDFGPSWSDGVALRRLVERLVPGASSSPIPALVTADQPIQNVNEAFRRGRELLHQPPTLTVMDVISGREEERMAAYVAALREAAESQQKHSSRSSSPAGAAEERVADTPAAEADGEGLTAAQTGHPAQFAVHLPQSTRLDLLVEMRSEAGDYFSQRLTPRSPPRRSLEDEAPTPASGSARPKSNIPVGYQVAGRTVNLWYRPPAAGWLSLSVICGGQHVDGSPFRVYVGEDDDEVRGDSRITTQPVTEAAKEPMTEGVKELLTEAVKEPVTEAAKKPVTEAVKEPVTEAVKEPVTEAVKEPVTEAVKEPVMEQMVEAVAEAISPSSRRPPPFRILSVVQEMSVDVIEPETDQYQPSTSPDSENIQTETCNDSGTSQPGGDKTPLSTEAALLSDQPEDEPSPDTANTDNIISPRPDLHLITPEATESHDKKDTRPAAVVQQAANPPGETAIPEPNAAEESGHPTPEATAAALVASVLAAAGAMVASAAEADSRGVGCPPGSQPNEHNESNQPVGEHNELIAVSLSAAAERKTVAPELSQAPWVSSDTLNELPPDQSDAKDAPQLIMEATGSEKEGAERETVPEGDVKEESTPNNAPVAVQPVNSAIQAEQLSRSEVVTESSSTSLQNESDNRKDETNEDQSATLKRPKPSRKISWQERIVVADSIDVIAFEEGGEEADEESFTPLTPVMEYTPSPPLYRRNTLNELEIVTHVPNSESKREVKIQQKRKLSRKESKIRMSRSRSSSGEPESPTTRDDRHENKEHPLCFAREKSVSDDEKSTPVVAELATPVETKATSVQSEDKENAGQEDGDRKEAVKDEKQKGRKISFIDRVDVVEVSVLQPEAEVSEGRFDRNPKLVIQDSIDEPADWIHAPLSESKKELEVLEKVHEEDEETAVPPAPPLDSSEVFLEKETVVETEKEAISTEKEIRPDVAKTPREKSAGDQESVDEEISSSILERSRRLQKSRILSMSTSSSDTDGEQAALASGDRNREVSRPRSSSESSQERDVTDKPKSTSSDSSSSSSEHNDAEKQSALQEKMTKSKSKPTRTTSSSSSSDGRSAEKEMLRGKKTQEKSRSDSSSSGSSSEDNDTKSEECQKTKTKSRVKSESVSRSSSSTDDNSPNGEQNKTRETIPKQINIPTDYEQCQPGDNILKEVSEEMVPQLMPKVKVNRDTDVSLEIALGQPLSRSRGQTSESSSGVQQKTTTAVPLSCVQTRPENISAIRVTSESDSSSSSEGEPKENEEGRPEIKETGEYSRASQALYPSTSEKTAADGTAPDMDKDSDFDVVALVTSVVNESCHPSGVIADEMQHTQTSAGKDHGHEDPKTVLMSEQQRPDSRSSSSSESSASSDGSVIQLTENANEKAATENKEVTPVSEAGSTAESDKAAKPEQPATSNKHREEENTLEDPNTSGSSSEGSDAERNKSSAKLPDAVAKSEDDADGKDVKPKTTRTSDTPLDYEEASVGGDDESINQTDIISAIEEAILRIEENDIERAPTLPEVASNERGPCEKANIVVAAKDATGHDDAEPTETKTTAPSSETSGMFGNDVAEDFEKEGKDIMSPENKQDPSPSNEIQHDAVREQPSEKHGSSSEFEAGIGKQDDCVVELQEVMPKQSYSPVKVLVPPKVEGIVRIPSEAVVEKTKTYDKKHDDGASRSTASTDPSSSGHKCCNAEEEKTSSDSSSSSDSESQRQREEARGDTVRKVNLSSKQRKRKSMSSGGSSPRSSSDSDDENVVKKSGGSSKANEASDDTKEIILFEDCHDEKSKSAGSSRLSSSSIKESKFHKSVDTDKEDGEASTRKQHKTSESSNSSHSSSSSDDDECKDSAKSCDTQDAARSQSDKSILSLDLKGDELNQTHKNGTELCDKKPTPGTPIVLQPRIAPQFVVADECLSTDSEDHEAQEVAMCIDAVQPYQTVERRSPLSPEERTTEAKAWEQEITETDTSMAPNEENIDLVIVKKEEKTFAKPPLPGKEREQTGVPGNKDERAGEKVTMEADTAATENQESKSSEATLSELERTRRHMIQSLAEPKNVPVLTPKEETTCFQEPVLEENSLTEFQELLPTKTTDQKIKLEPASPTTTGCKPKRKYSDDYSNFETPRDSRYRLQDMQARNKSYIGQQRTRCHPQYQIKPSLLPCVLEIRSQETPTKAASSVSDAKAHTESMEQKTPQKTRSLENQETCRADAPIASEETERSQRNAPAVGTQPQHSPLKTSSSSSPSSESDGDIPSTQEVPDRKKQNEMSKSKRMKNSQSSTSSESSSDSDSKDKSSRETSAPSMERQSNPPHKAERKMSSTSTSSSTSSDSDGSEHKQNKQSAPCKESRGKVSNSSSSSDSTSSSDSKPEKALKEKASDAKTIVVSPKKKAKSKTSSDSTSSSSDDEDQKVHRRKQGPKSIQKSSDESKKSSSRTEKDKKTSTQRSSSESSSSSETGKTSERNAAAVGQNVDSPPELHKKKLISSTSIDSSSSSSKFTDRCQETVPSSKKHKRKLSLSTSSDSSSSDDNVKTSEVLSDSNSSSSGKTHGATPKLTSERQEFFIDGTNNSDNDVSQPQLPAVPPPLLRPPLQMPFADDILEIVEIMPEAEETAKPDESVPDRPEKLDVDQRVDENYARNEGCLSPEQKTPLDDWVIVPKPAEDAHAAPRPTKDQVQPSKVSDNPTVHEEVKLDSPGKGEPHSPHGQPVSEWILKRDTAIDAGIYPTSTADISQRLEELQPDSPRPASTDHKRPCEPVTVQTSDDTSAGLCFAKLVKVTEAEGDETVRAEPFHVFEDDVFDNNTSKGSVSSTGPSQAILVDIEPDRPASVCDSPTERSAPNSNNSKKVPNGKSGDETYEASLCFIDTQPSSPTGETPCEETFAEESLPSTVKERTPVVWRRASVDRQVGKFNITCIVRPSEAHLHGSESKTSPPRSMDRKWLNLENYTIKQPPAPPKRTWTPTADEDEIVGSRTTVYMAPKTSPNARQELVTLHCVRNVDDDNSFTYLPEMRDLTPDTCDGEDGNHWDGKQQRKTSNNGKHPLLRRESSSADVKQRRLAYENGSPTTCKELRKVTPPHNTNLEERKQKLLENATDTVSKVAPPVAVQGKVGRLRAMFEQIDAGTARSPGLDDSLHNSRRYKSMMIIAASPETGLRATRRLEEPTLKLSVAPDSVKERSRSTVALHRPEAVTRGGDAVGSAPLKERSRSSAGLNRAASGTLEAGLSVAPSPLKERSRSTVALHRQEKPIGGGEAVDSGPLKERSQSTAELSPAMNVQRPATATAPAEVSASFSKRSGAPATSPSPLRNNNGSQNVRHSTPPPLDYVTLRERTLSSRELDRLEGGEQQAKLDAIRRYFEGLQDGDITSGDDADMLDDALIANPGFNRSLPRLDVSASDPRPPLQSLFSELETPGRKQKLSRSASSPLVSVEGGDSVASLLDQVRQLRRRASGGALSQASLNTSGASSTAELARHRDDGIVVFGPGMCQGKVNAVNRFQILVPHPDQAPEGVRMYSARTDASSRAELRDLHCNYHQVAYRVSQPGWYRLHVRLGGGARHVDLMTKVSH